MSTARLTTLALMLGLAGCATPPRSAALPGPGFPALTPRTQASGAPPSATQAATSFERADLAFEIFPDRQQIEGVATLDLVARAPLDRIELDLDRNLPVRAIAINGAPLAAGAWRNPDGRLSFALPRPAAAGERISVRIVYGGTPHVAVRAPWDGGFVWSKTADGKPYVATAVQGEGCDLFWPCFDHPLAEPRQVDLHITVPPGLAAPSNGVLQRVETLADGRRTYHWRTRNPNTYGIALNVAPYARLTGQYRSRYNNIIPIEFWHLPATPREASILFAEIAPTLDFFEATIGPYPFGGEKVGVVETPHKGMEHQTINAYGNEYARDAYGFDSLFQHEFAHEWFANQLTNADPDHFWLQEGFGSYMQPLYARWRTGEHGYHARLHALRAGLRNCKPIVSGRSRTVEDVYQWQRGGPGSDIYGKAAWMLHSLRMLIGDDDFFAATRRLTYGRRDPRPGNFRPVFATSDDFVRIVNEETGRDYRWFFDVYLREAALPELIAQRRGNRLSLDWKVPGNRPFPMPVEVQIGDRVERVLPGAGLAVPAGAHDVIDPAAKILKRSADIDALQRWQYARYLKTPRKPGDQPMQPPCIAP